ncbi:pyridoxal-phosphate dependent enzyme [Arthrobacter sp. 2MCAF14]|uniref:pyridoxal-phosphate dependent enzyme n=1 Tax=Arthrobacter sp. 2MCAF14 TaxID=3232982 RepID=UPI003F8EA349
MEMTTSVPMKSTVTEPAYIAPEARTWRCAPIQGGAPDFHLTIPGFFATPLVPAERLAEEFGVARVFVKDEAVRMGLGSYEVLGASWAVCRLLSVTLGASTIQTFDELLEAAAELGEFTLVTATQGHHGLAVAWMASALGLAAKVFVPSYAAASTIRDIAAEGAHVATVFGSYEDALTEAVNYVHGKRRSLLVQDTSWAGYGDVPRWIAEGYQTIFFELDRQLSSEETPPAGLVAVPIGVGSLAQAAVQHYRGQAANPQPSLLSVEAEKAAAVLASLRERRLQSLPPANTRLSELNAHTPSPLAWPFLRNGLDAAVAVSDAAALAAMTHNADGEPSLGAGGAACLAGLRLMLAGHGSAERRHRLGLDAHSTVVLVNTEAPDSLH